MEKTGTHAVYIQVLSLRPVVGWPQSSGASDLSPPHVVNIHNVKSGSHLLKQMRSDDNAPDKHGDFIDFPPCHWG